MPKTFGYTLDTEVRSASSSPRNMDRSTGTNTSLCIEYHDLETSFRMLAWTHSYLTYFSCVGHVINRLVWPAASDQTQSSRTLHCCWGSTSKSLGARLVLEAQKMAIVNSYVSPPSRSLHTSHTCPRGTKDSSAPSFLYRSLANCYDHAERVLYTS